MEGDGVGVGQVSEVSPLGAGQVVNSIFLHDGELGVAEGADLFQLIAEVQAQGKVLFEFDWFVDLDQGIVILQTCFVLGLPLATFVLFRKTVLFYLDSVERRVVVSQRKADLQRGLLLLDVEQVMGAGQDEVRSDEEASAVAGVLW